MFSIEREHGLNNCDQFRRSECKIPARMYALLEKILASIVIGLILPLLLFRLNVTPWSEPVRYGGVAVMSFGIAFLVYKYRQPGDDRISVKAHLTNFVISLVVLAIVALVYALLLSALSAFIGTERS